jgi:hypothetical protein
MIKEYLSIAIQAILTFIMFYVTVILVFSL